MAQSDPNRCFNRLTSSYSWCPCWCHVSSASQLQTPSSPRPPGPLCLILLLLLLLPQHLGLSGTQRANWFMSDQHAVFPKHPPINLEKPRPRFLCRPSTTATEGAKKRLTFTFGFLQITVGLEGFIAREEVLRKKVEWGPAFQIRDEQLTVTFFVFFPKVATQPCVLYKQSARWLKAMWKYNFTWNIAAQRPGLHIISYRLGDAYLFGTDYLNTFDE